MLVIKELRPSDFGMGRIRLILLGIGLAVYPQVLSHRFNIAPLLAGGSKGGGFFSDRS